METAIDGPGWRCLWAAECTLGEGPIWDATAGLVRFVDIQKSHIHRFDPASGACATWQAPCRVGSIGLRQTFSGLVAGTKLGFAFIDPDAGTFEVIGHPEPDLASNRFNDGKVDPFGNFWAGTMDDSRRDRSGALYRLAPDHRWTRIDPGYRISNGPAFSPAGDILYHTDTVDGTTFAFDLTADGVGNRRDFKHWDSVSGHPDGMTTDAEGYLWVAFWGGGCVRRVSPSGEIVAEHKLPVMNVTSMAFGGPRLDRLFVTSARQDLDAAALAAQPLAGGLFEVLGHGVRGLPGGEYAG